MIFEKHLSLKSIVILFLEIIPFIVASDFDILKKSFSYLKGDINPYDEIKLLNECGNSGTVTCNSLNQVTEININGYELNNADFKSAIKELSSLTYLTKLVIDKNIIPNSIILPEEIGNMRSLKSLVISNNEINNKVPDSSTIPESIGNLIDLEELVLSNVTVTGTIPKSISNLEKLKILDLSNNHLSESIPPELEEFISKLEKFDYSGQTKPVEISNSDSKAREPESELNPELKFESKPTNNKTILIIVFSVILLLIITVTVVLYRKWNIEKINDKDNNNYNNLLLNENIKNTLGKNNSINIVVNRSSLDLETKLPSYEKNNSISKVDDPLKSKTFVMSNKVSSISSVPSSKKNMLEPHSQLKIQDFEQQLHQQELQLQQQLQLQQLQLQQIQQMKSQLHQYKETPTPLSSGSKSSEKSNKKEKEQLKEQHSINNNQSIALSHNTVPLNATTRNISNNNNNNLQNQNYPFNIDYDELLPSYNDVVNN